MRKSAIRTMIGGSLILNTMFTPALAQQSAQQIINSLKPSGSLSDTTRGIKPLSPGGAVSAPHADDITVNHKSLSNNAFGNTTPPPTTYSSAQSGGAPSTSLAIAFRSGSADLTPRAMSQLDELGKALTSAQLASYNFKIVGHTDTVGQADANQTLSDQRAQAVKTYLESKYGVQDARLQATGVGENELLVQTPPQTPEPRNRQVQIINLGQ